MSSQMDVSSPAGSVLLQLLTLNISWQCRVSQCHPNVRARVKLSLLFIGAAPGFVLHQRAWKRLNLIPRNHQFPWLQMLAEGSAWALYIGRSDVCKRLHQLCLWQLEQRVQTVRSHRFKEPRSDTFGDVRCLSHRARCIFWVVWCVDILLTDVSGLDYVCRFCMPYCRSLPAGSLSFWCWTSPSEAMRQLDGIECNKMINYYMLYYIVTNH